MSFFDAPRPQYTKPLFVEGKQNGNLLKSPSRPIPPPQFTNSYRKDVSEQITIRCLPSSSLYAY